VPLRDVQRGIGSRPRIGKGIVREIPIETSLRVYWEYTGQYIIRRFYFSNRPNLTKIPEKMLKIAENHGPYTQYVRQPENIPCRSNRKLYTAKIAALILRKLPALRLMSARVARAAVLCLAISHFQ
jgi:hypothetical protein